MFTHWIAWLLLAIATPAFAQTATPTVTAPPQQSAQPMQISWMEQLGIRSFQVRMRIMMMDKVVLVPDAATYLDEISRWTLRARWPVLIEDDFYAPMFVRAFKPSKVIRRTSVGAMPAGETERRALAYQTVTKAWTVPGSTATPESPAQAFASVRFEPIGMVMTSMSDPAWTAAVALAAGHGQVLGWLDGNFDAPSAQFTPQQFLELSARVEDAARTTTLAYAALGDVIDAVTICRSLPAKAEVPVGAQWAPPQGASPKVGEPVAVTDALCRNADGSRWAVAAWIFGSEVRSAYTAMCSLFLSQKSVWMINTYPSDGEWGRYGVKEAVSMLNGAGYEATEYSGSQASTVSWLNMLMGGFKPDVLYMNSIGNMDYFEMLNAAKCFPEDVAMLQRPMAMHLIHSWSLTSPESRDMVGGRWLEHGVYAYVGSVFEPYLVAFVPPSLGATRMANMIPFLVASRWCEGPIDASWRVTTIGDPLMVIPPPSMPLPPRTPPDALDAAKGESDVKEDARTALVASKSSDDPAQFARALRDVVATGDDLMANQLWSLASTKGQATATACAPLALGSLFRQRQSDAFLAAYKLIAAPLPTDADMLWHLWTQQLGSIKDRAVLEWFGAQVRPTRPAVDLSRLAPEIKRVAGVEAAREVVGGWLLRTTDAQARQSITDLLSNLQ